jgi:hypothetical protein
MPSPLQAGNGPVVDRCTLKLRAAGTGSFGGADFAAGADLPEASAPRPFLHPITTRAGVTVTALRPADHVHHLGLSVAVSDLNGSNFWGGTTFTAEGPRILANHGRQVPGNWRQVPNGVAGKIAWMGADGAPVAREWRTILCHEHPDPQAWVLSMSSLLSAASGSDALRLSSSAVKGRAGAGYGGIFWRFPQAQSVVVETAAGVGPDVAHGSLSPWLSLNANIDGHPVGIVLLQNPLLEPLPWFIRSDEYLGAGPAVAWKNPRTVPAGQQLALGLHAVIRDGHIAGPEHVARLITQIPPAATAPAT